MRKSIILYTDESVKEQLSYISEVSPFCKNKRYINTKSETDWKKKHINWLFSNGDFETIL